jgi:hypothetical protein
MSDTSHPNSQTLCNVVVPRERFAAIIDACPAYLSPILEVVRDDGVAFLVISHGGLPFDLPTNIPVILLISDHIPEAKGPQAFHQVSLRGFVARCTGAVIVPRKPPPGAYYMAALLAAGARQDVVIVETRPEYEANWKAALDAINPDLDHSLGQAELLGDHLR